MKLTVVILFYYFRIQGNKFYFQNETLYIQKNYRTTTEEFVYTYIQCKSEFIQFIQLFTNFYTTLINDYILINVLQI